VQKLQKYYKLKIKVNILKAINLIESVFFFHLTVDSHLSKSIRVY